MKKAFTLMELLIVVMIIGILAMIAMPLYKKTVESSKATNALSIANMIANANKMYQLDNNAYISGHINDSCNSVSCATATGACKLVACGYLSKQQWSGYQWAFCACDGINCGTCPGASSCSGAGGVLACTSNYASTLGAPYNTWRYEIGQAGECIAYGTKVPPCPSL
ncbi:MAG: prepilin-type N-terminal cleavage/methylation domain-containing protein [Elusimicrobiales bacterium]|nr:prepilin-type N-terminal cleavage/methylation domain-containing protein [Elusimicrobiales bacterium]